MGNETLYQIALTLVNGIGPVQARLLLNQFGSAEDIFKANKKTLSHIDGIGEVTANSIKGFIGFVTAEKEIEFCQKHNILPLTQSNEYYPKKLLNCYDAPTLLYCKNNTNINGKKIISIVGTRNNSDYGRQFTEQFVEGLKGLDIIIVSGLAFGIDTIAHKSALHNGLPTIAVLGHGLKYIYPHENITLAKEIMNNGCLLSEFRHDVGPEKHNFPRRNRIVAGMSDATIVIETGIKGGSMITAELANGYHRDIFALPGKVTDAKSAGCLRLLYQNKAALLISTSQFLESMGWEQKKPQPKAQMEMFIDLSPEEKIIVDILKENTTTAIDDIFLKCNLSSSQVASALLSLELQNIVVGMPGKLYRIN